MSWKQNALLSLRPNASIVMNGDEVISYECDDPIPTDAQILDEANRLQQDYVDKQYQRDRQPVYPTIQDQLDMLYWDKVNNTDNWKQAIDAVKSAHPKP